MTSLAIVDAGVLIAALDASDPDHGRCVEELRRRDLHLVVPALVVTEVAYFAGKNFGPGVEAAFIRGIRDLEVEAPAVDEWASIADLVEKYADFPLGTVDASIAVLADRLDTDLILTLERRHFEAIRSPQGRTFRLLPDPRRVYEDPGPYAGEAAGAADLGV